MSWTVRGLDEAIRHLDEIAARAEDITPVTTVIAEDVKTFIDTRFDTSTSPAGEEWQPLAPSTVKRRRQGSSKPLVDTGQLRNSVNATGTPTGVQFGTNVPYAGPHQFGTSRIPRRAFLPVEPTDPVTWTPSGPAHTELVAYVEMVERYLTEGVVE